ncbi:unnamed protein product [Caenorhabditis bovis]|uniref:Uncharacterized protein n=1 Tax=Caenorhabditis bovis TaxID=2654633 RepID=A0A8S1EKL3_9PELO|nr:unnamed protein product [Caenorhabditis bovis]
MIRLVLPLLIIAVQQCHGLFNYFGDTQAVTVTGKLICNGRPADGVLVKMYEDGLIYDSKLDSTRTAADGTFMVSGTYTKITTIDPKVNIYHTCNYSGLCSKKVTIEIPHEYVALNTASNRNYDIGTINLANQFRGESIDCIH